MKTLLVAGCNGVNGTAITAHFAALAGWRVVTLSRSQDKPESADAHVVVDLLDADALAAIANAFDDVTHVFYAALKPADDPLTEADENGRMFAQLIDTVASSAKRLERVVFLQGGKVYGAQLGVYKTPAREDDSRHFPPNLYFRHEDYCRETSARQGWSWTALRPDIVVGHSVGSAMNLGNLIGVYGSLCRQLGVAMQFPGTAAAMQVLVNVTDADLLAQATQWAIDTGADGAFNITNGDVFRWKHAWPALAAAFGCEPGEAQPIDLQARLQSQSAAWKAMVGEHGLQRHDVLDLGQGAFGDFIFHVETDAIFDVGKARRAGFAQMHRQSIDSLLAHVEQMRERRLIPRFD